MNWITRPAQPAHKRVTVRAIRPADADLIDKMHRRLTPDSIYYRYLRYRPPTLTEIAAICRLDPTKGVGLVATVHAGAEYIEESIVGVAYYVREAAAGHQTAEPGILVEDRFQAQGIGRSLWQQLQQHAQRDGLHWLRVLTHPHNERVARLVQGAGLPYVATVHGDLHEYLVQIETPPNPIAVQVTKPLRSTLVGHWRHLRNQLSWHWQEL